MKNIVLTLLAATVLAGCAHKTLSDEELALQNADAKKMQNPDVRVVSPDIYLDHQPERTEVLREGRYTLINFSPEDGQKYLLDQSVTVNLLGKKKRALTATVEQGLRAALKDSGLSLCQSFSQDEPTLSTLYTRPLPKVHYQFGPMALRDALQMLAGPAYEITINDVSRTICFKLRPTPATRQINNAPAVETKTTTTTTTEIIEE